MKVTQSVMLLPVTFIRYVRLIHKKSAMKRIRSMSSTSDQVTAAGNELPESSVTFEVKKKPGAKKQGATSGTPFKK